MKIVFLSVYFNHHQIEFSSCLNSYDDIEYIFYQTESITEERVKLGWNQGLSFPSYVYDAGSLPNIKEIVEKADVVIFGSAPYSLVRERIKKGKITFIYSERLFKDNNAIKNFLRTIKYRIMWRQKNNCFLLSAGKFAASDYQKIGLFKDRSYKWGYFPPLRKYTEIDCIINSKESHSMVWVGRFLQWKHPELAISIAEFVKSKGISFHLYMIGEGEYRLDIEKYVNENDLSDCVSVLGGMSPEAVRAYMERSEILLFTSDRGEGWGAVLNEGMNSACVPVASRDAGSTSYLIKQNINGFAFALGMLDSAEEFIIQMLTNNDKRKQIALAAYQTILMNWNGRIAANRFISTIESIMKKKSTYFKEGICSEALSE